MDAEQICKIDRPKEGNNVPSLNRLYFYLTEGCNLACRHCWLAPKFDADGTRYSTLSPAHFETAIREAKPLGLSGVKLTGGEPLLHPQFIQLLKIVRREGLRLTVETNGMRCTSVVANEIAKSPDAFVSVSIDGADAATHEWVRGVKGSFKAAQQAVRNLSAAGIKPQVICSVMRHTADQLEAVIHMAEDLGAASVKFNLVQPTARGENLHETEEALSVAELIKLGRKVDLQLAPKTKLRLYYDYPMAFRPLSCLAQNGFSRCGIFGIMGVIADGHYALCGIGAHIPELIFGKVGTDRLKTIWRQNSVLTALRNELVPRLSGVCGDCLMKNRCLGSCVAQNYYRSKSLWAPFWFCDLAKQASLFPRSRLAN